MLNKLIQQGGQVNTIEQIFTNNILRPIVYTNNAIAFSRCKSCSSDLFVGNEISFDTYFIINREQNVKNFNVYILLKQSINDLKEDITTELILSKIDKVIIKDRDNVILSIDENGSITSNIFFNTPNIGEVIITLEKYVLSANYDIMFNSIRVQLLKNIVIIIHGEIRSVKEYIDRILKIISIESLTFIIDKNEPCTITFRNTTFGKSIFEFIDMFKEEQYKLSNHIDRLYPLYYSVIGSNKKYLFDNLVTFLYNNLIYNMDCKYTCLNNIHELYGKLIEFLIDKDIEMFTDQIINIHSNVNIMNNLQHNVVKKIPTTLDNTRIQFKNNLGNFVNVDNTLVDSGNLSYTSIPRKIVNMLELPIIPGCVLVSGAGGGETCNGYVELTFKLLDTDNTIEKEYTTIAFISDNINSMLLGNIDSLSQLYDDNYVIQYQKYDKHDQMNLIKIRAINTNITNDREFKMLIHDFDIAVRMNNGYMIYEVLKQIYSFISRNIDKFRYLKNFKIENKDILNQLSNIEQYIKNFIIQHTELSDDDSLRGLSDVLRTIQ